MLCVVCVTDVCVVSKTIVEMHGGRIGAGSSGEGEGSVFYFDLPVHSVDQFAFSRGSARSHSYEVDVHTEHQILGFEHEEVSGLVSTVPQESLIEMVKQAKVSASGSKSDALHSRSVEEAIPSRKTTGNMQKEERVRCLLVDDAATSRKILRRALLTMEGVECWEAESGVEALELVRQRQEQQKQGGEESSQSSGSVFDIIFMDAHMRGISGHVCTHRLRADMGFTGWIVGLTGDSSPELTRMFMLSGANTVYTKPLKISDLREIVNGEF